MKRLTKTKINDFIERWDRKTDKLDYWIFVLIMVGIYGGILLALWYLSSHSQPKPQPEPVLRLQEEIIRPSSYVFPPPDTLPYVFNEKKFYAEVTEYTKIETCPYRQCHTANGDIPEKDKVVACPRSLRLGQPITIDGIRYTCTDRTAQRFDGRFDIYHGATSNDYQEAKAFGIQKLEVEIL